MSFPLNPNLFGPTVCMPFTPQNLDQYFSNPSKGTVNNLRYLAKTTNFNNLDQKTIELVAYKSTYDELNILLEEGLPPNLFYSPCENSGPFSCTFTSITLIELAIKAAANPSFDENSDPIKKVKILLEKQGPNHLLGYQECNGNSCLKAIIDCYTQKSFR